MRKLFILFSLIPILAFAQEGRYGHSVSSGGLSEAQVQTLISDSTYFKAIAANRIVLKSVSDYFSVGRVLTAGQAGRGFLNVIGFGDTLMTIIGDGNRTVGDSSITILANGTVKIGTTTAPSGSGKLIVPGLTCESDMYITGNALAMTGANAQIQLNSSLQRIYYDATNKMQFFVAGAAAHVMDNNGYVGINNGGLKSRNQGVLTVRGNGTTDSLAVFRNDKNATLDSTAIILKDGSFVTGEWRIRSGADSLVFHHDGVPVFAILPDGTTADLVAGTPPTLWRNIPPQEYIWLLRTGVLLLLLLVAFKVYDYAKPRIRKHQTLPGEI